MNVYLLLECMDSFARCASTETVGTDDRGQHAFADVGGVIHVTVLKWTHIGFFWRRNELILFGRTGLC